MSSTPNNKRQFETDPQDPVAAALPAVAALMGQNKEPGEFVPLPGSLARDTNFKSVGGDDGRAEVLLLRRPYSKRLNQFLTEAVTDLVSFDYPVEDKFENGDAGVLEELLEMYDRVGTAVPAPLTKKLSELRLINRSRPGATYNPKREIYVGVAPLVRSLKDARQVDQLCKEVFGVGASALAAPLAFVIGHKDSSANDLKALLGHIERANPVVTPGLKSPPTDDRKVAARTDDRKVAARGTSSAATRLGEEAYGTARASAYGPRAASARSGGARAATSVRPFASARSEVTAVASFPRSAGGRPFPLGHTAEATECSGWLWVPSRQDWFKVVQTDGCPYPTPEDTTKTCELGDWVFCPHTKTWYKRG